jgi:hypothetical protein
MTIEDTQMSNTSTGGPAFPTERNLTQGMTLRDYFAAKAMQALITSRHTDYENGWYDEAMVAASAYDMAESMLKARES